MRGGGKGEGGREGGMRGGGKGEGGREGGRDVPVGGTPPPALGGARFFQKMEWFRWPPPLKRRA